MKTLKDHIILYDANCPMCDAYSKAFVKTGMLDLSGRESYQEIPAEACPYVDMQRALNEIALVNVKTGEVSYGIDSIFKVVGNSIPFLLPLFKWKPFLFIMTKVYAFISYNRRVIIPPSVSDTKGLKPTFRLDYRIAYLVVTWFFTGWILTHYAQILKPTLPGGSAFREFLICGFQLFVQGIVIRVLSPLDTWNYLGNMMTISFAGAIILLPVILLSNFIHIPLSLAIFYFMLTAGIMLLEHLRRTRILNLSWWLTVSWVSYRLIVLLLIILSR